ncbi:MAG: 16S rRNA (guanine(966)-N(2))-methyltransferase RsmD [Alphaproteobacteria bacterium]|nr:16S rRNA (guanine(966)-N(2))-methyltransferase RsmD [Alphaproteobacteria bacterium]
MKEFEHMRIIAGQLRGRLLVSPQTESIRPTSDRVRQAAFNIIEHKLNFSFADKIVLDIFGGTGALGFESLSRGAQSVIYFDTLKEAHLVARQNAENLKLIDQIIFRQMDALNPPMASHPVDFVFIDPPYNMQLAEKALVAFKSKNWFKKETYFMVEELKNVNPNWPNFLTQIDERVYGKTKIIFLQIKEET